MSPPADEPPEGYIAWHEWAERQHKKGQRQERCALCAKFRFPVELSGRIIVGHPRTSLGVVVETRSPVCKSCDARVPA